MPVSVNVTLIPAATIRHIGTHLADLHQLAIALCRRVAWILRLLDLPDQYLERLADVLVISCARLSPAALELICHLLALFGANLSLFGSKIALVSYNDNRY